MRLIYKEKYSCFHSGRERLLQLSPNTYRKLTPVHFIDSMASAAAVVGGRSSRPRASTAKGQERSSTANGKNRSNKPPVGDIVASKSLVPTYRLSIGSLIGTYIRTNFLFSDFLKEVKLNVVVEIFPVTVATSIHSILTAHRPMARLYLIRHLLHQSSRVEWLTSMGMGNLTPLRPQLRPPAWPVPDWPLKKSSNPISRLKCEYILNYNLSLFEKKSM